MCHFEEPCPYWELEWTAEVAADREQVARLLWCGEGQAQPDGRTRPFRALNEGEEREAARYIRDVFDSFGLKTRLDSYRTRSTARLPGIQEHDAL